MATRYAVATGNWSNTATWDGGTLPTASDDVYADGKTVTIDQNVTVLSLRTTARSGGTAGGGFTMSTAYTVDCSAGSGFVAGTTTCLAISASTGTITLKGPVVGGTGTNAFGVSASDNATINLTGSCTGNTYSGLYLTGTSPQINVTGVVTGGVGGTSAGIYATGASAVISVTGNVNGGGGNTSCGIYATGTSAQITIVGNLLGDGGYLSAAVYLLGNTATVTVTGNVTGGTAGASGSAGGIWATGNAPIISVTGNVTGGTGANCFGIYAAGASSLVTAIGVITAVVATNNAIYSSATSTPYGVIASGDFVDAPNGLVAIYSRFLRVIATSPSGTTKYANNAGFPNGTLVSRISPDLTPGMPAASNVRKSTVYGYNSELTGTLAVPAAASVAYGIPVDNTTGTAALAPSDVAALVGAQIAAALDSTP